MTEARGKSDRPPIWENPLSEALRIGISVRGYVAETVGTDGEATSASFWERRLKASVGPWDELSAGPGPANFGFGLGAVLNIIDDVQATKAEVVPVDTTCDNLIEQIAGTTARIFAQHGATVSSFDVGREARVFLRATPASWLEAGYSVFFATFGQEGLQSITGVGFSGLSGLTFQVLAPKSVRRVCSDLEKNFMIAFSATIVTDGAEASLVDLDLWPSDERKNTEWLSSMCEATTGLEEKNWQRLVANCEASSSRRTVSEVAPVAQGHSHGERVFSGPLITEIGRAANFANSDEKPVLVTDSLLPKDSTGLENCGGLVLHKEGPASHIGILARNLGLAVITEVEEYEYADSEKVVLNGREIRAGQNVTLSESGGALYIGDVIMETSPVEGIANILNETAESNVLLSVGVSSPEHSNLRIGLCRSEHQILGSKAGDAFLKYLSKVAVDPSFNELPLEVKSRLSEALVSTLKTANGAQVNYRLMDLDLEETLGGWRHGDPETVIESKHLRSVRGPRWAFASGFYDWQIEMAVNCAFSIGNNTDVDLSISVPSLSTLEEYFYLQEIFQEKLRGRQLDRVRVELVPMIENPSMISAMETMATHQSDFCIGLNDLTQFTLGLDRSSWSAISGFYVGARLLKSDPFSVFDARSIAPVLSFAIDQVKRRNPSARFLFCGEPAASFSAHWSLGGRANTFFSVASDAWATSVLSSFKADSLRSGNPGFCAAPMLKCSEEDKQRATSMLSSGHRLSAQEIALEWYERNCSLATANFTRNWKVLKKLLVDAIFGKREGKYFEPNWHPHQVACYIKQLNDPNRAARVSVFPSNISCHSESFVVPDPNSIENTTAILNGLDRQAMLNVFPQQNPDQLCFRLVSFPENMTIEAGWGQAMYVFEEERGDHPILGYSKSKGSIRGQHPGTPKMLINAFEVFLTEKLEWLEVVHSVLPKLFGLENFALEGYFDPKSLSTKIVDIDLPLDLVWNSLD
jgi:phosphohistidine swiveling domain-containing protein